MRHMAKNEAKSGTTGELSAVAIAKPAQRALAAAGYTRLEQLANVREAELLKLHGMGPKAIDQLRQALAAQGLAFADGSADT